jgi:prevent-host-death family protein
VNLRRDNRTTTNNLTNIYGHICYDPIMTTTFSLHEAKSRLSHVISLAEAGESVEITRHGKVVAIVTGATATPRSPGSGIGTVSYVGPFELTEDEIDDLFHRDLDQ